jgi:hypothetical protein
MLCKLADDAAMGIEGIFVIDPATNAYYIYQRGGLDSPRRLLDSRWLGDPLRRDQGLLA